MTSGKAAFARVVCWLCMPAMLAAVVGCQPERLAQSRMERRGANLRWAAGKLADREQKSVVWLDRDWRYIQDRLELDAARTDRDLAELDSMIRRDIDRWNARQPVYLREAERILRGKPENIEPTAIWLFY